MMRRIHVLLVDADASARETVKTVLRRLDAEVEVEEVTSTSGLAASLGHARDLVVAEVHLPDGARLGVLHALEASLPRVPTILFTDAPREDVVIAAINARMDDFVLKAAGVRRLESAIRSALQRTPDAAAGR